MSEQTQHSNYSEQHPAGKTPAWLQGYRNWVSTLDRGQRIRYRALQIAASISAVIILVWGAAGLLIREPDLPDVPIVPIIPDQSQSSVPGDISTGKSPPVDNPGGDVGQEPAQLPGTEEVHISQSGQQPGVYTVLVVGRDTVSGSTDTMILATYDTVENEVTAMSLPRDTMVNVSWNTKKLNTVFSYYKGSDKKTQVEKGMAALKTHVGKLTGIIPNFYVCVEWDAVGELVDAIDGVTFDVPYNMDYDDPEQDLHIHQTKGLRHLDGEDAMEVIRWRKNNANSPYGHVEIGDSGRMKIQQSFLMAVAKECLQLKNLWNIPELAQVFMKNVKTDLSVGNLIWFGQKAVGIDTQSGITFCTLPYSGYSRGTSYLLPEVDEMVEMVNDGLNPYQRDITRSDLEVLVLKKDGSMTVTSGTLADKALAKPPAPKKDDTSSTQNGDKSETQPPAPDASQTQQPAQEQTAPPTEQPAAQEGEQGTAVQPEQNASPGEEAKAPAPAAGEERQKQEGEGSVSILPARPTPIQ